MDSLTHIIIGSATGQVMLGKKEGNKALLWGAIAANIPDFDSAITSLFSPASAVLVHRGFSHSILFALAVSPILGLIAAKLFKSANKWEWIGLTLTAILSHIAIDCFNSYGTGILEPFSNIRVAYDTMPIVDLMLLVPILLLMSAALFFKTKSKTRTVLSSIVIVFTVAYVGYSIFVKRAIDTRVKQLLISQKIEHSRFLTAPLPITNLIWLAVAEDNEGFYYSYISLKDDKIASWHYLRKNHQLLEAYSKSDEVKKLQRFTKGFYTVTSKGDTIVLNDLRFGGMDITSDNWFVFSFKIWGNNKEPNISRSHPNRKMSSENIKLYWERIKEPKKSLNEKY